MMKSEFLTNASDFAVCSSTSAQSACDLAEEELHAILRRFEVLDMILQTFEESPVILQNFGGFVKILRISILQTFEAMFEIHSNI